MPLDGPHYTKPDRWTPRHYGDELYEEGVDGRDASVDLLVDPTALDTFSRRACCKAEVRCPNCRRRRRAALLVDVRHVPDDLTDGASWACDACWGTWIRPSGRVGRSGSREQRMCEAEWCALHGAPKKVVDEFREVVRKRKSRGQRVDERIGDRVDLDAVSEEANVPTELPPLPERPEGRGA